jgi:DTW domain-containing protein YfiP
LIDVERGSVRCPRCRISLAFCFCAHLRSVTTSTAVDLIVHYRETSRASNTAHLADLTLPRARVHPRGLLGRPLDAAAVLLPGHQPLYLYPSPGARLLDAGFVESLRRRDARPLQLIVPDGSWSQAKTVRGREAAFGGLPQVRLQGHRSRYRLRRAPREDGLSTYEAVAHAISIVEGPERAAPLFENFEVMVEQHLKSRGLIPFTHATRAPQRRPSR